ncbi:MAG TPA: PspC domain-containing protein [Solimonas sp.]|nr:PspC domain-containing protein [Solimonas sp.]
MSIRDRIRSNGGLFPGLYRYPQRGWAAGVVAGLGRYFGWNVKLLRVLLIISLVCSGFFPVGVIYLVLWYLMDEAPGTENPTDASGYRSSRWGRRGYRSSRYAYQAPESDPAPRTPNMGDLKARFSRMEDRLRSMEECVTSSEFELRRELRKLES